MKNILHRMVKTNGISLHIAELGQGPLVLLVHGFPESWRSWRHQMTALAEAGYRAVAMDQRGYGQSDKPDAVEAYNIFQLASDLTGLVHALGEERAVIVGHDWGAPASWHAAQLRPDLFRAVTLMSVPFCVVRDLSPVPPTKLMGRMGADGEIFYQLFYQEPGVAEAVYESDIKGALAMGFYCLSGSASDDDRRSAVYLRTDGLDGGRISTLPAWISEQELDFYVQEFTRSGFRGPLNWYRNIDYNWENTGFLSGSKLAQPLLFIAGIKDPVLDMYPGTVEALESNAPGLWRKVLIPDVGHWVQQEAPDQVNQLLLEFLEGLK